MNTLLTWFLLTMVITLSAIDIELINQEMISESELIKATKTSIYLQKDDFLFLINRNAIHSPDISPINEQNKINFNSYARVIEINRKNIWDHDYFSYLQHTFLWLKKILFLSDL